MLPLALATTPSVEGKTENCGNYRRLGEHPAQVKPEGQEQDDQDLQPYKKMPFWLARFAAPSFEALPLGFESICLPSIKANIWRG